MSPSIDRRVAIVAGVGPGVGIAVARRFAREGYDLGLIARGRERLDGFAAEISALGVRAAAESADLGEPKQLVTAFQALRDKMGPAGVLIYNGALWREQRAMEIDAETFQRDLALSCTGALLAAQQVYPDMKSAGAGTILFTGGGLALYPAFGAIVPSLTAGKSALRGLTYAMAQELEPDGIHVATVTIAGTVAAGTPFAPDLIAERYWMLHCEPRDGWSVENVFDGR